MPLPYQIEYSPDAEDHLRALTQRHQTVVLDTVDRQLRHEPTVRTRNRKPMRPNPVAPCPGSSGSVIFASTTT